MQAHSILMLFHLLYDEEIVEVDCHGIGCHSTYDFCLSEYGVVKLEQGLYFSLEFVL